MKKLKYEMCIFENSKMNGVYDKVDKSYKFPFDFIKFSQPKESYLINNGAEHVVDSWSYTKGYKEKVLHTGLIPVPTKEGSFFFGNNLNDKNKKDFILLSVITRNKVALYVVKNRNPRSKVKFARELIKQIE